MIVTIADLEKLRFCQVVTGSLSIQVTDPNADYTALYDISMIEGNNDICFGMFVHAD